MFSTPFLIQRCSIKRPLNDYTNERLGNAVSLDYMGSAEFEFGAVGKSLRVMGEKGIKIHTIVLPFNNGEDFKSLRVAFVEGTNEEDKQTYFDYIEKMWKEGYKAFRLKERSDFTEKQVDVNIDLWWDLRNNVMWSFDKKFMKRLGGHLQASIDYMNKQK